MPRPTEEQRRSVLSIDLGASYTKLAWRPPWGEGNVFNSPSDSLEIDVKPHTPSIAVDLGDGQGFRFGTNAEKLNPGPNGRIHRNWKAILFDSGSDQIALSEAQEIAEGFLRWIKKKLGTCHPEYDLATAKLRICIPALNESAHGEGRLRQAAIAAGWSNALEFISEPAANLIGLASAGKNITREVPTGFTIDWEKMFPRLFFDAMTLPAQRRIPGKPVRFFVMDIGAFTTDAAICNITESGEVQICDQRSFEHGIAQIDEQLTGTIEACGLNPNMLSEWDFRAIKEDIYQGKESVVTSGDQKITLGANCMNQQLSNFAKKAVEIRLIAV